ncbi:MULTISPECIES: hypothetical protein [Polymorphospora]|uniref:ATP-grasp-modified RiPP n=1 Tax=Polymorphospora lycopeni TaxID=3140240 RepID=A0ABV5CYG0_9ACTN
MNPSRPATVIAPLFSPTALLPLSEPGGVSYPMEHTPGPLRPYSATLAVPMPQVGKHHTTSTRPATALPTQRSKDGEVVSDTTQDTGMDS